MRTQVYGVGMPTRQSHTNNFQTKLWIFTKVGMNLTPLGITSPLHFKLLPQIRIRPLPEYSCKVRKTIPVLRLWSAVWCQIFKH